MDNNSNIIDYVAWGGDPGKSDDTAVITDQWFDGAYIDTSTLQANETIGRDKDSNDTNTPSDWENSTTSRADPFGVNATRKTPGTQNVDHIIPEFPMFVLPIMIIVIFIYASNRRHSYNFLKINHKHKKKRSYEKKKR
jgi:hypothetical protein